MALPPFNHGVRVVQAGSEPRPMEIADVSSIGRAFIAEDADDDIFPLNKPVAFFTHEADKVAALADRRWRAETGGVSFSGSTIRSDATSQAKITGAVALFQNDLAMLWIDFEAQPGVWITLDKVTMTAIGIAVGRHVQSCFSHARALSDLIVNAADVAALDTIDIDTGWPSL